MLDVRPTRDPRADKLREVAEADLAVQVIRNERLEALLEYTAMMTDVELPEVDDE